MKEAAMHESHCSFFQPYLLSDGSRVPVWDRIGASVVENSHGGVSKQDNGVPIDTVAVPNWWFLLRCCTSRVAALFRPYQLSEGSMKPVWRRIWASVVENPHGGESKQDSVVPIDTMAVPNWCFLLRCCTNRVTASLDLTYYPGDRGNQCGTGLGRQWLRIHMEDFRNRTVWSRLTPWPFRPGVSC